MRRSLALLAAAVALPLAVPASAELSVGATAPDFTAKGALAGKPFTVHLKAALKKGPVVLYFFPAAYTSGCNAEAHAFAEAMPEFEKAGATVIGMTAGNLDRIVEFSNDTKLCSGKFAVAGATPAIIKSYDLPPLKMPDGRTLSGPMAGWTGRTSYVIAPDRKVLLSYDNLSPLDHIKRSLEAVQKYRATHKRG
jgi:peroxiredoxin Q/BCP